MSDGAAWDASVDIVVVGSGAGGLTAALVAADAGGRALVIEKSNEYGGTSATSGGGIWIPDSPLAAEAGHRDSAEEAFTYIRGLTAPNVPDAQIHAFVRNAPRMLAWLQQHTPVRYKSDPYPDYHVENPGGRPGYRTHMPESFDGRRLGDDILTLRSSSPAANLMGRINMRYEDRDVLLYRTAGWWRTMMRMLWRYYTDVPHRLRSTKDRNLTLGNALVGGLRAALNEQRVPLWLNTRMTRLIRDERGLVRGIEAMRDARPIRIEAVRAVILAGGGFERNADMRRRYLSASTDPTVSGSQVNNMGDTIRAAEEAGAALRNMQSAWCAPVFRVPGEKRARLSAIERALPGCIMVNQAGRRYVNEAASYHIVGKAMIALDHPGAGTFPSWMIFDHRFRHLYPMGPLLPMVPDRMQPKGVRAILRTSPTLGELAERIGVPADALEETVARFNDTAASGEDPDYHRGAAAYDRMYGDPRVSPNPTLAPITKPPFYAFPIYAGDIGTNGGILTDEHARALDTAGQPIAGLYAVGNNAASVMGESYPGAGATLGPAMTFGYVAARHAMGAND
jgi:3-oxosteroid 1-dehydrogenase